MADVPVDTVYGERGASGRVGRVASPARLELEGGDPSGRGVGRPSDRHLDIARRYLANDDHHAFCGGSRRELRRARVLS
jgi:hypothetical protein